MRTGEVEVRLKLWPHGWSAVVMAQCEMGQLPIQRPLLAPLKLSLYSAAIARRTLKAATTAILEAAIMGVDLVVASAPRDCR